MPQKAPRPEIAYYNSDDEPCRIHRDKDGDLTSDAFRAGKGIVSIDAFDIEEHGYVVGQARYEAMVRERHQSVEAESPKYKTRSPSAILHSREMRYSGAGGTVNIWPSSFCS